MAEAIVVGRLHADLYPQQVGVRLEDASTFERCLKSPSGITGYLASLDSLAKNSPTMSNPKMMTSVSGTMTGPEDASAVRVRPRRLRAFLALAAGGEQRERDRYPWRKEQQDPNSVAEHHPSSFAIALSQLTVAACA